MYWFHNHTRPTSFGSGVRGVLKLSAMPKLAQPWQAYLNKFQETKLKDSIDLAWKYHLLQVADGDAPTKTKFEVWNSVAQRLYQQESDEVKQEVEEHHKNMRYSGDVPVRNKGLQR